MPRSSVLIAGLLLAVTCESAAAGPRPHLKVSTSLFHNAQISSCTWRHPNGTHCSPLRYEGTGLSRHPVFPNDCRCVHTRTITGGGGTPGTVEVRPPQNTIKGGGGTPAPSRSVPPINRMRFAS